MTMHIEMIAAASNFGWPKRKPAESHPVDRATPEKSTSPIGQAISVPMMIEISTAVWPMKPRKTGRSPR